MNFSNNKICNSQENSDYGMSFEIGTSIKKPFNMSMDMSESGTSFNRYINRSSKFSTNSAENLFS